MQRDINALLPRRAGSGGRLWPLIAMIGCAAVACGPDDDAFHTSGQGGSAVTPDVTASDSGGRGKDSVGGPCLGDQTCAGLFDPGACHRGVCRVGSCQAEVKPDGSACEDGDACTGPDTCLGGGCKAGVPAHCDDGNPCTEDSCLATTGACLAIAREGVCDANAPCERGHCLQSQCVGLPLGATVAFEGDLGVTGLARGDKRMVVVARGSGNGAASLIHVRDVAGGPVADLPLAVTRLRAVAATQASTPASTPASAAAFAIAGDSGWDDAQPPAADATPTQGVVIGLDAAGAQLWHTSLGTPQHDSLAAVAFAPDGSILAVGARYLGGPAPAQGWLVRLAPSGAQLVDYHYAGPTQTRLWGVAAAGVGAVVGGSQHSSDGTFRRPVVLWTAADGALVGVVQPKLQGAALAVARVTDGRVLGLIGEEAAGDAMIAAWSADRQPLWQTPLLQAGVVSARALVAGDATAWVLGTTADGVARLAQIALGGGAVDWARTVDEVTLPRALAAGPRQWWIGGAAASGAPIGLLRQTDAFGHASCAASGACATLVACSDGDPCTADACASASGCVHPARSNGTPCGPGAICAEAACTP